MEKTGGNAMHYRLLAACGALASLLMTNCGGASSDAAPAPSRPPTPVYVEITRAEPVRETLTVPGIVEAAARIELGFRIDGFVESFAVDEGDRVAAGDVIATLDLDDLEREARVARATLERAKAHTDEAKLLLDRQQDLFEARNASKQVFDQARLAFTMADADARSAALALEAAEDRLAKGVLRAPITGYIESRLLEAHEAASAGVPVVVLAELDRVHVRAAVADTAVSALTVGAPAQISAAAWSDRMFAGTITTIAVAADSQTRTVPFEVQVENPDLALRSELVVDVHLQTSVLQDAVTLPPSAILRDASEDPFCFVASGPAETLHATRQPLELGPIRGERIVIAHGLRDGMRVIVRGQHFLREGDPVVVGNP